MSKIRIKRQTKKYDSKLFLLTLSLSIIGLIAVADASAPIAVSGFSDKYYFVKQQLVWFFVGFSLLFVFSKIKYSFWEKIATPVFFVSIATLIMLFIPGLGTRALGAKRWITLGPVSFQPSEFVKLTLCLYLAKLASVEKRPYVYFVPIILVAVLLMLQPDLGTTLVMVSMGMAQIFVSGIAILPFLGAIALSFILSLLIIITSGYRRARLLTFIKQTQDPLGKGYHIRQVLIALGSGGIFGVGLGHSRQKYLFLPEATTDSIFAVIAEELGFLGASVLILAYLYFVFRCLKIAGNSPDNFSRIFATGVGAWVGGQAFLNIGSMLAVVPLTGVPLPFVSYGGSALVAILTAVGILLNISRYKSARKRS